jgi:RimJ/RimL family protein N-acetyltransferase
MNADIEFRRITLTDVDALTELALSAIPDSPELQVSPRKVRAMVEFFAASSEHFQLAAFEDGIPVAGLAMLVTEMPFHERLEGTIVFCFSRAAGAGRHLLRALLKFVNNSMQIRRVSWSMNAGFDQRIITMAKNLGFQSEHPTFMYHKGA